MEAFNLKLAIELQLKDRHLAQEALADMPPRPEADWDPVGTSALNVSDRSAEYKYDLFIRGFLKAFKHKAA